MAGNKGIVPVSFYRFSAANRTITFSNDYAGLDLAEITYITNIKNGIATVIYDPFDATKGGTLNGLTLTLAFNTTTMADTDPLQIITGFTPVNADPQLVKKVDSVTDNIQTDLLQNISDNLDYLSLSLDQTEGIQMNIRDSVTKKDVQGAIVPSDAPAPIEYVLKTASDQLVIDTIGYQSTTIHILTSNIISAAINIEGSNDPKFGWTALPNIYYSPFTNQLIGATNITLGANVSPTFYTSNLYRFIRIRFLSYSSGTVSIVAYLRSSPFTSPLLNNPVNLTTINGTSATVGTSGATGTTGTITGGIFVGGVYTPGQNALANPVIIGGREAPATSTLAGITRPNLLDSQGRFILGADYDATRPRDPITGLAQGPSGTAPVRGVGGIQNNIVGAQSLTVADVSQDFGDTHIMLLRQILTELKILNQQFVEMPNIMNNPSYELSEPQEFRNDPTFDTNN